MNNLKELIALNRQLQSLLSNPNPKSSIWTQALDKILKKLGELERKLKPRYEWLTYEWTRYEWLTYEWL